MGRPSLHMTLYYYLVIVLLYFYLSNSCNLVLYAHAIESPQYTVVHSESDFEVRLYTESSWMSALVRGTTSFEKSTKDGFHRLYQYIHGGNLNSSHIMMTAPVLTSINSSSGGSDYFVRFYIPAKNVGNPPQPNPELNVQLDKWSSHCIAVRKFTGFAQDDDINKEIEALVNSINEHLTGKAAILEDRSYYSVAQYNASKHLSGRLNEVWINVSGFTAEGCPYDQGKY
uniref:SOUL heme-binding protein n=1 Tax=Fagus sylvatica TaxID=28930 RepID=A0A2N9IPW3_FAGSY